MKELIEKCKKCDYWCDPKERGYGKNPYAEFKAGYCDLYDSDVENLIECEISEEI